MNKKLFILVLCLMAVVCNAFTSYAATGQQIPPRHDYVIARAASEIHIDGVLDEEVWRKATVIDIPYEWQPGDNTVPPVKTDCLVTYDDQNLYVAFRSFDPKPSQIRAHLLDRDSIETFIKDDHVGFLIDTFNDERRGFQFRINPLGVQADAFNSELEGIEDWSFDLIWASAGKITKDGYTVEIAIPFNQLRFPRSTAAETWGFEAFRSYPRTVRHRMASHWTERDRSCGLCQLNKITGFEGISPGRNVEVDPTLTSIRTDRRNDFPNGSLENADSKVDPGITARWGITTSLTLNGTLNPDFSQVEADAAQLDINKRFALFFPEKRPFFLEGSDFFSTPLQAVFTRTVADPTYGIKLTGKQGPNGLGVFVARDSLNNLIFPGNQESSFDSLNEDVTSAVFRYKRDIGKGSSIGALYSGREGQDYHNRQAGIDGFWRASNNDTVQYQFLHTDTQYPEQLALDHQQPLDSFGGNGFVVNYNHNSRNWFWFGGYTDLDREFRSDTGFIPRVDIRTAESNVRRNVWGDSGRWFTFIDYGFRAVRTEDHDGTVTDRTLDAYIDYNGPLQSGASFNLLRDKIFFNGITFDLNHQTSFFQFQPLGNFNFQIFEEFGDAVDFENTRPARILNLNPAIGYKFGRHVETSLDHNYLRLEVAGRQLFTANLTQTRILYHFSTRTFVRAIFQYTHIDRDVNLYTFPVEPVTKQLFTQFLFSYKLNPQTVVLAGYSDNYSGLQTVSLTRTNRTFFLKIGYAWTR